MTTADELLQGELQDAGDKFHLLIEKINAITQRRNTIQYVAAAKVERAEAFNREAQALASEAQELVRQVAEMNSWLRDAYQQANEYIEQANTMKNLLWGLT
jgi:uncharacterized coiled-coil DUF342 family protein